MNPAPTLPERWILSRLQRTIQTVNAALGGYDMDDACGALYEFLWNEYCDWFVELCKPALQGTDGPAKDGARRTLYGVLETTLRLLHPIMPFGTEEIWQNLPGTEGSISLAPYPVADESLLDPEAEEKLSHVMKAARYLRNQKALWNIPPSQTLEVLIEDSAATHDFFEGMMPSFEKMIGIKFIHFTGNFPSGPLLHEVISNIVFSISREALTQGVDIDLDKSRVEQDLSKIRRKIDAISTRLREPNFLVLAAPEAVRKARSDLQELQDKEFGLYNRLQMLNME